MIAFEVSVNGRVLRRIGIGDLGRLDALVRRWRFKDHKRELRDEIILQTAGLPESDGGLVIWEEVPLAVGDIVNIRVVEEEDFAIDPPSERYPSRILPNSEMIGIREHRKKKR